MVKRFISFMGLFLACILFASAKSAFVKVTDASKLAHGDVIILASSAKGKAAGAMGTGKFLTAVDATFKGNTVECDSAIQITLVNAGNLWMLNTLEGDQWANIWAKAAKTLTRVYESGSQNVWTISIDEDGFATIASTDSTFGRFLYNASSPRFLNYTSATSASMLLPEIYRLQEVDEDAVAAPSFSVPAGNYYEAQNVAITSEVEGVNIWYKFNDDAEFTQYTAPLVVSADALITAYAELEGKKSEEISAKYFIAKSYALAEVAELAAEGQPIVLNLENAVIDSIYTTKSGNRNGVYLTAGTTAIEIYAYDVPEEWVAGGTLTGAVKGLWKEYNGIKEVCPENWEGLTYTAPKVYPTELQNGTFDDEADLITGNIRTYAADKTGTDVANMQPVSGWEIVSNGDGRAAGAFAYGSTYFLGGDGSFAPKADADGNAEGGCLGILGVWTGEAVYTQEVSMPAGDYNFTYFVYNASGTTAIATNRFGVLVGEKTLYSEDKTFAVGEWKKCTVPFTVPEDGTIVTFSLGFVAANVGNGSMPHLFVDNVTVEKVTSIDTTPLTDAIAAAQETLATYAEGSESYTILSEAIAAAQAAVETIASNDDLAAALDALKAGESAAAKAQYAQIEPGKYYFQNVASGKFVSSGAQWATHAVFTDRNQGYDLELVALADGKYNIKTNVANGAKVYMSADGYVDAAATAFIFEEAGEEGVYTIFNGTTYLGYDGSTDIVSATLTDPEDAAAHWKLYSASDLLATFASATETNPVNATFLVTGPNFNHLDTNRSNAWVTVPAINGLRNSSNTTVLNTHCAEFWSKGVVASTQTLTDIPNGYYKLSAFAYYRQGNSTDYVNYESLTNAAYLVANNDSLPINSILDFAKEAADADNGFTTEIKYQGKSYFTPNSLTDAAKCFATGAYDQSLIVEVTDGTLTLGVAKDAGVAADWLVFDEFQLLYLGTAETRFDGTYYLYNEATNKFASRGAAWGTQGIASDFGYAVVLDVNAEGKTQIKYSDWTNTNLAVDQNGGTNMFTDTGAATYWQFAADATGEATFGLNGKFLGIVEDGSLNLVDSANVCTWKLVTPEEYKEILAANQKAQFLSVLEAAGMTEEDFALCANVDITDSVKSASLINGITGWTWTSSSNRQGNGSPVSNVNGTEVFQGCGALTQTVEGLASGVYKVSMNAFYRDGNNGDVFSRYANGVSNVPAYLSANGSKVQIADWAAYAEKNGTAYKPNSMAEALALFNEGKYVIETYAFVGEDGKLALEINQPAYIGGCWLIMANVKLSYLANSVSDEQIETLLASIPETPYNADIKAQVTAAAEALAASKSLADFQALTVLLPDAKKSADIYANINSEIVKAEVFDEAGQAKFAELAADALNAYAEESITDGKAELAAVQAALVEASKAQTTPGSDMTLAVTNAACTAIDGWTINPVSSGFELNTWSTENDASGMKVPFVQFWKGAGNMLPNATISHTTIEGLQPGLYTVTAFVRAFNEGNSTNYPSGVTMFANDSVGADISTYETALFNNSTVGYGTMTVQCEVGEDGKLDFGFNIANAVTDWMAFKNVTLTFDGPAETEPFTLDYTFESYVGDSYEEFKATVDMAAIFEALGVSSIDELDIFAVMGDGTLDPNYQVGTTDGWRNADGMWQGWGDQARYCVKADFTSEMNQVYYIGGMPGQNLEPVSYTATYAFAKKVAEGEEAPVAYVNINLNYVERPAVTLNIVGEEDVQFAVENFTSGYTTTITSGSLDVTAGLAEIGCDADSVEVYAYYTDEEGNPVFVADANKATSYDGWFYLDGTPKFWNDINASEDNRGIYVKFDPTQENAITAIGTFPSETCGYDSTSYKVKWVIANPATNEGYVYNITVTGEAEAVAIGGLKNAKKVDWNNAYDLTGRKVATPVKGNIYIVNGQKVLFK